MLRRMGWKMSNALQEFADQRIDALYKQPLKTLEEALAIHGWQMGENVCCGEKIEVRDFLGGAYYGGCKKCGKFVADICAPSFGNGSVSFIDTDKFPADTDWNRTWIAGTKEVIGHG